MLFGPQSSIATGTGESALATDGVNVLVAWANGTSIVVLKSTNQGYAFPAVGSAVTVDTNAANTDVQLNEPFNRDPVTGRLHLTWNRNTNVGGSKPQLMTSHSDDGGATWSTAIQLDDGTIHSNNSFYRTGVLVYNGVVDVVYTCELNGTFTTDGLYHVASTDGGATWTSPAKLYTTGIVDPYEPNAIIGDDGTAHISWYDPQVVNNQGGDIYYAQGAWSAAGFQWQAAITQVTSGQTCGRPRITASRGIVMVVTNTNFGGSVADLATVRSTDNGKTWGSVVTQATHTTGPLDHPWIVLDSDNGAMIWDDLSTTPLTYGFKLSTDGGATWSTGPTPLVTTGSSDAPKLLVTNDVLLAVGTSTGSNLIYAAYPLFSPAVPSSAVIDNFNRANENPLSNGGTWSADDILGAGDQTKLVSNQIVRQVAAGSFDRAGSFRNDTTIAGGLGETFVTVATADQGELNLILGDESTKNGYHIGASVGDFGGGSVLSRVAGGTSTGLQTAASPSLATGDKWLLRITPNDVVVYYFASGTDWQEWSRARDTTFRSDFRAAINIAGVAGVPALDDFGGSTLVVPSNSVVPVASGAVVLRTVVTVGKGTWATAQGATPARYSYQWQTSPAGANTWTNVALGFLPFLTVVDARSDHRCVVTASNSYGITSANSNVLPAPPIVAPMLATAARPMPPRGPAGMIAAALRAVRRFVAPVPAAPSLRRSSPGYTVTVTPDPVTTRLASLKIAGPNTSVLAKLAETAQNSTVTIPIPGGTSTRSSRDPADTGKSSSFYIQ